jgi:hypothetical protein
LNRKTKDIQKKTKIDLVDLENDYLKHKETIKLISNRNLSKYQEIIIEIHDKHLFPIDYIAAGLLSAASASIGKSHKLEVKHGWQEK